MHRIMDTIVQYMVACKLKRNLIATQSLCILLAIVEPDIPCQGRSDDKEEALRLN